jgi:hypothetical protein
MVHPEPENPGIVFLIVTDAILYNKGIDHVPDPCSLSFPRLIALVILEGAAHPARNNNIFITGIRFTVSIISGSDVCERPSETKKMCIFAGVFPGPPCHMRSCQCSGYHGKPGNQPGADG